MGRCFVMVGENIYCPKCNKEGKTFGLITLDDLDDTIIYFCKKCKTKWKVKVQALPDK